MGIHLGNSFKIKGYHSNIPSTNLWHYDTSPAWARGFVYSAHAHQGWEWIYALEIPSKLKDTAVTFPGPIFSIIIHHQHG